jgi:hypothetical protein
LQFTLKYDDKLVKINNIQAIDLEGFSDKNYAIFEKEGRATLSWNGNKMSGSKLFKITLQVIKSGYLNEALTLNSDITPAEAYNTEGAVQDVKLLFGSKNTEGVTSEFTLLPNAPNPFKNETTIRFRLPSDVAIKLTIFDKQGRVLESINRSFSKGYNEWVVDLSDKNTSGVLFYRIETATDTAIGRMIILK